MSDDDGFFLEKTKITIVGLGLMGGSLALDLRGHCAEIVGVSRSPETLSYALDHRFVDRISDFNSALDSDLLILAAPVRTIIGQLQQMKKLSTRAQTTPSTAILDLGSTKTEIVRAMQNLPLRFDPIGGHPMCGKEMTGIRYAEPGLYRDKIFIITPLARTSRKAMALVQEMIAIIGAQPLVLTPGQQDILVSLTSHLPYLAATALMRVALSKGDDQLWTVAASGFMDTTRLAASDLTMMMDILFTNRNAILVALKDYRKELDSLATLIESGDEEVLRATLASAQQQRVDLLKKLKMSTIRPANK